MSGEYKITIDGVEYVADRARMPSREFSADEIEQLYRPGMWIEEPPGHLRPMTMLEGVRGAALRQAKYNEFLERRECCGGPIERLIICPIAGRRCVKLVIAEEMVREYQRDLNRAKDGR